MSTIEIPYLEALEALEASNHISQVSMLLDQSPKYKIDQLPWPEYPYKPAVSFAIGYHEKHLVLKYYVVENNIAATQNLPNSDVYKDTCVEVFISFGNNEAYYNLEFNCIGTCHVGYGSKKENRTLLDPLLIEQIERQCTITKVASSENIQWELTLKIPFTLFSHDLSIENFKDQRCRINFYKCGDELQEPHFLAWNTIESPNPNFHLPAFFGEAHFN